MATVLEELVEEVLRITSKTREDLAKDSLEFSELNAFLNDNGEPVLEFDTLGQSFLLTPEGVFTFDEMGSAFVPRPEFRKAIEGYLGWRLAVLKRFNL